MSAPLELKFRIDAVPPEGRAFAGELPVEVMAEALTGLVGELGYRVDTPARVEGKVYKSSGGELVVDARIAMSVGFDCVRCLEARTLDIALRHDHVFSKSVDDDPERGFDEAALNAPDEHLLEGEELDLVPVLREDVVLAVPMNPSCRTEGVEADAPCAELNLETQDEAATIDPRWAPLLKLKNELN